MKVKFIKKKTEILKKKNLQFFLYRLLMINLSKVSIKVLKTSAYLYKNSIFFSETF